MTKPPSSPDLFFAELSRNLLTPNVSRYGMIGTNMAYELSYGSGIDPETTIYGVTVVEWDEKTGKAQIDHDLSDSFFDPQDAELYISDLIANQSNNEELEAPYAGLYGIDFDEPNQSEE